MLAALGATPDEDRVYRQLVTVIAADPTLIAAATGLTADGAREAAEALVTRGLAYESDGWYEAAPPHVAERLIEERLRALRAAQDAVADLGQAYRRRQLSGDDIVEIVTGARDIAARTGRIQREARSEILALAKLPLITGDPHDADVVVSSPHVTSRTVYDTAVLAQPGMLNEIDRYHWARDEHRSYQGVPLKLLIVDRSIAMLPGHQDSKAVGAVVLVHPGVLLDALIALFENIWSAAVPLVIGPNSDPVPAPGSPLSVGDARLLSQLLSGLTDDAIAAHQEVSPRTVQRRVQALMTAAGARTRMQLAWHAGRHGWLATPRRSSDRDTGEPEAPTEWETADPSS